MDGELDNWHQHQNVLDILKIPHSNSEKWPWHQDLDQFPLWKFQQSCISFSSNGFCSLKLSSVVFWLEKWKDILKCCQYYLNLVHFILTCLICNKIDEIQDTATLFPFKSSSLARRLLHSLRHPPSWGSANKIVISWPVADRLVKSDEYAYQYLFTDFNIRRVVEPHDFFHSSHLAVYLLILIYVR